MTEGATPVVLAIDVEPDDPEFPPGSDAPWLGFERCIELFEDIRGRLTRATGSHARFTWFLRMDRQIEQGYGSATWGAERYAKQLDRVRQSGDEIGVHPHAWRWDAGASRWIVDVADEAWVEDCTRTSFEAYEQVFGERCRAHRAGDRFMSDGLMAVMRELGVKIDLTVEPGMRGVPAAPGRPNTADVPDMALVPRAPYVPSSSDWRRPDPNAAADLLEVPLTSADPGPLLGRLRATARRLRSGRRVLHRPLLPWSPRVGPRIWDLVAADVRGGALPALAFAMRSHAALEDESRNALLASVSALERHEMVSSLAFLTASEARERLSEGQAARR